MCAIYTGRPPENPKQVLIKVPFIAAGRCPETPENNHHHHESIRRQKCRRALTENNSYLGPTIVVPYRFAPSTTRIDAAMNKQCLGFFTASTPRSKTFARFSKNFRALGTEQRPDIVHVSISATTACQNFCPRSYCVYASQYFGA